MLVQVSVQSLRLDRASRTPVVILQENDGERVLPIWIGPSEAGAIASELADMKYPRPLTHDLLASVVGGLGGALQKVIISRVEENTYFAEMIIRRNGEVISVDARPSDSIAVALRLQARVDPVEKSQGCGDVSEGRVEIVGRPRRDHLFETPALFIIPMISTTYP